MSQQHNTAHKIQPVSPSQWEEAMVRFSKRGAVIFLSYCRYWEKHGFVQQCLAEKLVGQGVKVFWLDGMGWRKYKPTVSIESPHLKVEQMPALPGRRFAPLRWLSTKLQARRVEQIRKQFPTAVIWVQAGIDEELAKALPYIDVYSTFDDPYYSDPNGMLCQKAKVVYCQNTFTLHKMQDVLGAKAKLLLPPSKIPLSVLGKRGSKKNVQKRKRVGYIGSFFSQDFNLALFETFVQMCPNWDFFLMGRTDREGLKWVRRLKKYQNFEYRPWVPREQVGEAWESLDLTLLLYHLHRTQDGAFPVKVLESLAFGVPCVATSVPKTLDLESHIPRSSFPNKLIELARKEINRPKPEIKALYEHFSLQMNPERHLSLVSTTL